MKDHPKHYLADVPHELRCRVLDLCILRRWHDAYDLLQQQGFTQYELHELVWFHDWAPATLPQPAPDPAIPSETSPAPEANHESPPALTGEVSPTAFTALPVTTSPPAAIHESSNPLIREARSLLAEPNLNGSPPPVKVYKFRSKVARLPETVRDNLNALFQSGASYSQVIAWLNAQGYTSFNKVNLHNWRIGGFKYWLRERTIKPEGEPTDA